jgi:CRISPR/Cas system-associated protein endoribonuclease Cas2
VKKMRILVMLNPTNKYGTKMAYTELRKFLIKDGYLRIGQELFMRITPNRKTAEKAEQNRRLYRTFTGVRIHCRICPPLLWR